MWSRVGRALGLFGPTAPETEPFDSTDFSTDASPPPPAPPAQPTRRPIRPFLPPSMLFPLVPLNWHPAPPTRAVDGQGPRPADERQLRTILRYASSKSSGIIARLSWLAEFDAYRLSITTPLWTLDLPRPPDAPKRLHHEWRQRALKELHHYKQLTTAEYHERSSS